jgi:hypothetical protein
MQYAHNFYNIPFNHLLFCFIIRAFFPLCPCFLVYFISVCKNYILGPNIQEDYEDMLDLMLQMCTVESSY